MTTCAECLTELSTVRLSDLRAESTAVIHYSSCPICRRVAEDLFHAENQLAHAFSEVSPCSSPYDIAATAVADSGFQTRRRIARVFRVILLTAGGALFVAAAQTFLDRDGGGDSRATESIALRCITAAQAADLATPYLRSDGASVVIHDPTLRMITIRGVVDEVVAARIQIDAVDNAGRCTVTSGGTGESSAPVVVGSPVAAEAQSPNPPDDK